ncbi:GNAT family N-acetyltransferase [Paenibacillus sp. GCM10027626]|uniref:GNAT family N-acetyltransferase n=1 Tax=Paenibacillus sp. GCM10027626 TaxID=3273411 RepID=UPI00363B914C
MMSLTNMLRGLKDDLPARALLALWEHDAESLRFWRASSNFVYVFELHGKPYYLRFIHEEDQSRVQLEAELNFIHYLLKQGYAAAPPVRSLSGEWIETAETDHGTYYGVVFAQAAGVSLAIEQMSEQQLYQWGQSLATLHHLSAAYPRQNVPHQSWNDALAFISATLQSSAARIDSELLPQLQHAVNRLHRQFMQLPAGTADVGIVHYDFEPDNLFYMADETKYCVIDFNDGMLHWFMMDITSAIRGLLEVSDESAEYKLQLFLNGYRSVKELDEQYASLLPLFQSFSELYTLARLLRSVAGMEALPASAPEWADQLRAKLLGVCDQIMARYHKKIVLQPVTAENWYECTQLEVTAEQTAWFPVSSVYWLAESAYCGFTPLAIYAGDQLVGLAIYAVDPEDGSYWIMAFLIDKQFQGQGFGRAAMQRLIHYMHERHHCPKIVLGHRPNNMRAAALYASLGFDEVMRTGHEIIRELKLS